MKIFGGEKTRGVISSRNPAKNKSDIDEFYDVGCLRGTDTQGGESRVPGFGVRGWTGVCPFAG